MDMQIDHADAADPSGPSGPSGKQRLGRRSFLRNGLLASAGVAAVATAGIATGGPAAAAAATAAGTDSLLDRIQKSKKVKVGVDLGFAPLQFRDAKTNEPTGYSIEVLKLMMKELGATIEYVEIPFGELFAAQLAGRFDMGGIPVTNLPSRGLKAAFAGAPAFLEGSYVILKKGSTVKTASALNDAGLTIAVLAGSSQAAAAKLNFPKAKLKELADQAATVQDVATGRSEAVFIGEFGVADALKQNAGLSLLNSPPIFVAHNTFWMPQGDFKMWSFVTQFLLFKATDLTLADLWQKFVGVEAAKVGLKSAAVYDPWLGSSTVLTPK